MRSIGLLPSVTFDPRTGHMMRALVLSLLSILAACTETIAEPKVEIPPSGLDWEDGGLPFYGAPREVLPYTGTEKVVLDAQEQIPDGLTLQSAVVRRSCGPLNGVCHNQKEYPDLHTPANFLDSIGAPCNVQSGNPEGVFDRCERVGDRLEIGEDGRRLEIGYVDFIAPDGDGELIVSPTMPGLHLHFKEKASMEHQGAWRTSKFIRTLVRSDRRVEDLSYASYTSRVHLFDEGRHVVLEVANYQVGTILNLIAVGIEQGDLNRNGIYGARPIDGRTYGPIPLIDPGSPETSYLIARMRGFMRRDTPEGEIIEEVPGTRMPLANQPFNVPELLALFCYIEGLEPDEPPPPLSSPIDYRNCSYAQDTSRLDGLALEGEPGDCGFETRIRRFMATNCGGCHDGSQYAAGGLTLIGHDFFDRLLLPSIDDPLGRPLIVPGDPESSYLYLKVGGALTAGQSEEDYLEQHQIAGVLMPYAGDGYRPLDPAMMADLRAFIAAGASPTDPCTTPNAPIDPDPVDDPGEEPEGD